MYLITHHSPHPKTSKEQPFLAGYKKYKYSQKAILKIWSAEIKCLLRFAIASFGAKFLKNC
jgi:hypothetical protein